QRVLAGGNGRKRKAKSEKRKYKAGDLFIFAFHFSFFALQHTRAGRPRALFGREAEATRPKPR
ncbi:MAG: hypothetical protein ACK54H_04140, partial [Phycisphaerales bacterium]